MLYVSWAPQNTNTYSIRITKIYDKLQDEDHYLKSLFLKQFLKAIFIHEELQKCFTLPTVYKEI